MNKSMLLKIASIIMVLVIGFTFAACQNNNNVNDNNENANSQVEDKNNNKNDNKEDAKEEVKELSGTVSIAGSTSVQPLAQDIADMFMTINKDVKIDIQGIGSSAGVKAAYEKTADIGTASRNLKEAEREWGLTEHVVALDGIAVVVHPSNGVSDLTSEQVKEIYMGEITNWSEVGGEDKDIQVCIREAGSGTRGAFEELFELIEKNDAGEKVYLVKEEGALVADSNGAQKQNVISHENAIGYISMGYLDEQVSGLKINGVDPTVENIKGGTYIVARPFLMLTNGEVNEVTQAYLDYIFSEEGQDIVAEKYIRVDK